MSLRDEIKEQMMMARATGKRKAVIGPLTVQEGLTNAVHNVMDEYDFRVIIGSKSFIRNPKDKYIEKYVDRTIDEVMNFLFNSAKRKLRELEIEYMRGNSPRDIEAAFDELYKELS